MPHDKSPGDPLVVEKPLPRNADQGTDTPYMEDNPYKGDEERAARLAIETRRRTGGWVLVGIVLLAIGLATAFYVVSHRRAAAENSLTSETSAALSDPPPVDVVPVTYAPKTYRLTLPGETRGWYEAMIYARVSGYVKKWFVDIGDRVKEGQILATIETPDLDQELVATLGKVEAAKAQVKLAEAEAHFAEVTYARYKNAPKGMVSDLERDQKEADYKTSLARVSAAQSDLNSTQANVDQLRAMDAFKKVVAPFDGLIGERRVDIGDLVTAGSTASTTSLYKIVQPDPMRVFVDVPQQAAAQIHDGDAATVTAQEYAGRKFEGRVARNARSLNASARTLRVEVDVPNHDFALLSGMYVQVSFEIGERKPALQIPASALNFRSGGPQVAVVGNDGRVKFHDVTIVKDLGTAVEVGTGVAAQDRVALNISNQISDGDRVTPIALEQPAAPATAPAPQAVTDASTTSH